MHAHMHAHIHHHSCLLQSTHTHARTHTHNQQRQQNKKLLMNRKQGWASWFCLLCPHSEPIFRKSGDVSCGQICFVWQRVACSLLQEFALNQINIIMIQFYLDHLLPVVFIVFSTPAKPAYWLGRRCFSGFIPVCVCGCAYVGVGGCWFVFVCFSITSSMSEICLGFVHRIPCFKFSVHVDSYCCHLHRCHVHLVLTPGSVGEILGENLVH